MLLTVFPLVLSIIFISFLIALFLSVGLAIYTFKIQGNKAANAFGVLMLVIGFWILLKTISLFIYSIPTAELVEKINLLLMVLISPLLFLVAVYHTNIPKWFRKKHMAFLFVVPGIMYLLVFTSSFHHLLFYDFKVIIEYEIPIHIFKNSYGFIVKNIYAYLFIICTFGILIKSLFSVNRNFRGQMILFIIGLFIPIFYDALYVLGISPLKNFNLGPVFLSVGNCFLAWSMFGNRFFKILSVARNLIIDNMPDIMIITNNENNIIDINKSGEILFDFKKDNILNHSFCDVFNAYPDLIQHYSRENATNEISVLKNDQKLFFSISISPFLDNEKKSPAFIVLLHDITERINAETQIKRLSTGIEQSPVTVVITNLAGNIEYVNPAFCKITGYSLEEVLGNNPRVLKGNTPPETHVNLWETVTAGNVWHGEFINKKKSGELYYEEATIAPIKNDKNEIINFIAIKSNISQRKIAEEELNRERALLRSLIDSIPDYIFVKDINGVYLLANNAIVKFFGRPWQEVVGKTDYDFVDTETAKFFIEKDRLVIDSGKSNTNEEQVTYPSGEKVWLETTKTPFMGLDGKFQGIIGVSRDISSRKQNEEALRKSRANLLAMVENTNDNIWAIDTSYRLIFINMQFENAFFSNYGVSLLPGMNLIEALPDSMRELWKSRYDRALAKERFLFEEHFQFDKLHFYFEVSMNPIIAENTVIGVSVFSRDISERKKTENQLNERKDEIEAQNEELNVLNEELQITVIALHEAKTRAEESEELFRQLMNYSPIYIYIKDLDLKPIRLSRNYEQLLGSPIHKLIGKTNDELWPSDFSKKLTTGDLQVLTDDKPIETELELNGKLYTSIKFPIYLDRKPRYLAGFLIDITERKMIENKIQEQNDALKELNATKDRFFSIIAHDLKSPFIAILGFSDYLANNIEICSPHEIKLFANNIHVSATQTYKLLENLLDWSKIQRGLVKPDLQIHNLANMISEMQLLNAENAKSKSITLQNNVKNDINIQCDVDMTKTILRNLISNAIKFTNENGVVTIDANSKEQFVEIRIQDNGIGIPAETIPHLFSIEKNTSTKGTANEIGTGLGLILCKELVENQGGEIWIESTEGEGSNFYFTVYQAKPFIL